MLNKYYIVHWEPKPIMILLFGCNSSHPSWLTNFQLWNAICSGLFSRDQGVSGRFEAASQGLAGIKVSWERVQELGHDRGCRPVSWICSLCLLDPSSVYHTEVVSKGWYPTFGCKEAVLFRHPFLQPSFTPFASYLQTYLSHFSFALGTSMAPTVALVVLLWISQCLLQFPQSKSQCVHQDAQAWICLYFPDTPLPFTLLSDST